MLHFISNYHILTKILKENDRLAVVHRKLTNTLESRKYISHNFTFIFVPFLCFVGIIGEVYLRFL